MGGSLANEGDSLQSIKIKGLAENLAISPNSLDVTAMRPENAHSNFLAKSIR
jgi:hypothetical protein